MNREVSCRHARYDIRRKRNSSRSLTRSWPLTLESTLENGIRIRKVHPRPRQHTTRRARQRRPQSRSVGVHARTGVERMNEALRHQQSRDYVEGYANSGPPSAPHSMPRGAKGPAHTGTCTARGYSRGVTPNHHHSADSEPGHICKSPQARRPEPDPFVLNGYAKCH